MKPARFLSSLVVLSLAGGLPAEEPLRLDLGDGVQLEMVLVKKGKFRQGSPPSEVGRSDDETLHSVTLTRDFYLGKYPVTRGQFARFVKATGYRTEAERGPSGGFGFDGAKLVQRKEFTWRNPGFRQTDEHPVTLVTYDDALAFTAWLAKKTGRAVTLPTEAQWEYACRGGTTTRIYQSDADEDAKAIAWFKANAGDGTRPVGQKKPNAFGLYDMSGNVNQWCRDWYGAYPAGVVDDPEETRKAGDPARRILRGGSWLREARHCRSAARFRNTPGSRNADNGFRIAIAARNAGESKAPRDGRAALALASMPMGVVMPVLGFTFEMLTPFHLLCFLIPIGGAVLVLILVLKRVIEASRSADQAIRRGPGPRRGTTRGMSTRVVPDGFWLEGPSLPHGSVVHYRYRTGGQWRTGTCPIQPGPQGHFIYTGAQPSDIVIDNVVLPSTSGTDFGGYEPGPQPSTPTSELLVSEPPATSGESFGGYPSAY
jgi:formylglycine-generating enzyme required for sulfatase activity